MDITEFSATLYFDDQPHLRAQALVEAWGREGYACEDQQGDAAFRGFRGGTFVIVEQAVPVNHAEHPRSFPAMAAVDIDYGSMFCIDHRAGYADFLAAHFEAELTFRIQAEPQAPKTAHNEWVAVLLGIHQAYPCAPSGCTTWACWSAAWTWTSICTTPVHRPSSRRSSLRCWPLARSSPRTAW